MKIKLILSLIALTSVSLNYSMDWSSEKFTANKMLIRGAYSSDLNLIKEALINGANINYKNESNCTALMFADNTYIIKFLLDSNADVNIGQGETTLSCQFLFNPEHPKKKLANIKLLLEAGADLTIKDSIYQNNVIEQAKDNCQEQEIIECLINHLEIQKQKVKTEVDLHLPPVLTNIVSEYLFDEELKEKMGEGVI